MGMIVPTLHRVFSMCGYWSRTVHYQRANTRTRYLTVCCPGLGRGVCTSVSVPGTERSPTTHVPPVRRSLTLYGRRAPPPPRRSPPVLGAPVRSCQPDPHLQASKLSVPTSGGDLCRVLGTEDLRPPNSYVEAGHPVWLYWETEPKRR